MSRRKLTFAQKWQVVGMRTSGLRLPKKALQFGLHTVSFRVYESAI